MVAFSTVPEQPLPAKVVDGPDYLKLPLAWTPTRRFDHHQVYEYQLALGAGKVAILRLVADKGWAMTIAAAPGRPEIDRGLFGTPHDALMVLMAEVVFPDDDVEAPPAGADADQPPAEEGAPG